MDRGAWYAIVHGVTKSHTQLGNWTTQHVLQDDHWVSFHFFFLFLFLFPALLTILLTYSIRKLKVYIHVYIAK